MHQPIPKQILIVDDDHTTTLILVHCLKPVMAEKIVVRTGQEAIDIVKTSPPDLILLDYSMPGISGIETLRHIRRIPSGKDIPIIMITGSDQTRIRQEAKDLHTLLFMPKPFHPSLLIKLSKEILDL